MSILQVLSLRYMDPPSFLMAPFRFIAQGLDPQTPEITMHWRSFEQISPHVKRAVLAAEDQRFLTHQGFDFIELNDALKDMASGKGYRGASTITMQVARTVFLWPARTWIRKGLEAYYTVLLELFLTKEKGFWKFISILWIGGKGSGALERPQKHTFMFPPAASPEARQHSLRPCCPAPIAGLPQSPMPGC